VLVVSHEASRTGAPRVAVELLGALAAAGHRTTVLHRWGGPLSGELDAAAAAHCGDPLRVPRVLLRRRRATAAMADRVERWSARRILRRLRPDVVWCNTVLTWRWAAEASAAGIPSLLYGHEQDDWAGVVPERFDAPGGAPVRLVGCSASAARVLATAAGLDPDAVAVLASPVDVAGVRSRAIRPVRSDRPLVVGCGRADSRKGFDVFLAAAGRSAARGDAAEWRWVGRPPARTGPLPPNVRLVGEVGDAVPHLAAATVMACPSRADSFPLVVLEAMALGRPVVASALPGIVEQLDGTGRLVPPGDPESLDDAVADLLADEDGARRLGGAAARRCEELWDVARFRTRVAELVGEVAATTGVRPLVVAHLLGRLSSGGGVQVVVRRLAGHADPGSLDLHVVTMRPPWDDVSDLPVTLHPLGFAGSRLRAVDRVRIMWGAAREVRRIRPQVVQLHSGMAWMGLLARAVALRTPFVLEVHDAPGSGRHGRWTDRFEGFCIRRLGMTAVCHSRQVADALQDRSNVPARRIRRFPLGVETDRFRPRGDEERTAFRACHGLPGEGLLAVSVGRPVPSKRFDLAVEAVARARARGAEVSLLLIGSSGDSALEEQVRTQGVSDHVHLWGGVPDDVLQAAVGSADVLVSTSEYEGFGLTLIEGMACGLPVVATAVGGVTDVVVDGVTGFLVPPGDAGAVAARLCELANSPALRARMGEAALQRARSRFPADRGAREFTGVYRELVR
jgi:glycosyltransferase involved in cell wall biosynthesis